MTPPLILEPSHLFPPALAPLVRDRLAQKGGCLCELRDHELVHLLTTVFFAGLETYEGEHNPIGVAFIGRSTVDFIMSEGAAGGLPLYRWKILRFASPRPFAIRELVKLAVAGDGRHIYSAVGILDDDTLGIVGLAREGVNGGGDDPFVKVVSSRPGCMSIHRGRERLIEYERGAVLAVGDDEVFSGGPVHRALIEAARGAGVDDAVLPYYLHAVDVLVRELAAHGRGGILIVSADEQPAVAASTTYRMLLDSSIAALLRLAWRVGVTGDGPPGAFRQLLKNAFLTESERMVEELGRLTAIDGAVLLNRDLALIAFGVILPVGQQVVVLDASASGDEREATIDFGSRGTRHRAAATYAEEHPGSVVFVASEDGQMSCMLREDPEASVRLWRLATGAHAR